MRRLTRVGLLVATIFLLTAPVAAAGWVVPSTAGGRGRALIMPSGQAASASVTGRNVTVTWTKSTLPNGTDVQDYQVTRYNASSGASSSPLTSCSGNVTGLTCTETGAPSGSWKYAITPRWNNWVGTTGPQSATVTVATPTLSFSTSTNITSLDAVLSGQVTGYKAGQSVTFRLDNATTGTILQGTATPSSIPTGGQSSVEVTIPRGTSNGSHTVYAVGSQGDVAGTSINVNVPVFIPSSLSLLNGGGTAGNIQQGDTVDVTYSHAVELSSFCSSWSGVGANQSISSNNTVRVDVLNNAAPSGNDVLRVTTVGACGGQFHFGEVALGSSAFVTGDTAFYGTGSNKSSITWNNTSRLLTVTLGRRESGPVPGSVVLPTTATYTPDPAIQSTVGAAISGSASRTGVQF